MFSFSSRGTRLWTGVLLLLTALCASTAHAKWYASSTSNTQYVAGWTQMPDFDQVRNGLGNDGKMYCVPTSALNMMAYIARHGYPEIGPGSQNYYSWYSPDNVNLATGNLIVMGFVMGTDAFDGTGGNGCMDGLVNWLPGGFLIFNKWAGNGSPPRVSDLGTHLLLGNVVMPVVGWYDTDDYPFIYRNGGHALTLTHVARSGNNYEIQWRDPANEQDDLATQSLFTSHAYSTQAELVFRDGFNPMVLDKIVGYGSAYLDSYYAIMPVVGLTQNEDKLKLRFITPRWLTDVGRPLYRFVNSPSSQILRAVLSDTGLWSMLLTDDGKIWKYDQLNPDMVEVALIDDPKDLVFSRLGKMYTLGGRTLRCFVFDEEGNATQETFAIVSLNADSLIADDFSDSLLLLDPVARQIIRYNYELTEVLETIDVDVNHLRGKGSVAVRPGDGRIFVTSDANTVLYELVESDGVYTPVPFAEGCINPTGLNVTDDGQVIVSCDGSVMVFQEADGVWQENTEHPFYGLEGGESLYIPTSRTNFDRSIHDTPAYRNVLPTEFSDPIAECEGDLDEDGDCDQADLGILLASYGVDGGGDLDGDGATTQADLGILLSAYGCRP
jgi:hypothetical protein